MEAPQWFKEHIEEDRALFFERPTKQEMEALIEKVVHRVLTDFFTKAGKGTKFWLITAATIVGSLVVIGGGLKTFLAWVGFTYMK